MAMAYNTKKRRMTTGKPYRINARMQRRQDLIYLTRSGRPGAVMRGGSTQQVQASEDNLKARVAELEATTKSLSSMVQAAGERFAAEKPESTLTRYCRTHGIQTFSEDPTERLRGLLSEFDIEESAVDIVRDVRNNP